MVKTMEINVGSTDRIFRLVLGVILLAVGAYFLLSNELVIGGVLVLISLIPLVTGILSTCPLCSIFGISTCNTK